MAGERHDPLDRLLDDALAAYSQAEPRAGIEQRVLNRVRAEGRSARFMLPRWAWAIPALGALLGGIVIREHRAPAPPQVVRTRQSPPPAPVIAQRIEPERPQRKAPRVVPYAGAPKQAEFPMRAPVTPQERALVALVRSAPDEALRALGETASTQIDPLRVDQIVVKPLPTSDGSE